MDINIPLVSYKDGVGPSVLLENIIRTILTNMPLGMYRLPYRVCIVISVVEFLLFLFLGSNID
jgi:hypothetical protein